MMYRIVIRMDSLDGDEDLVNVEKEMNEKD